MYDNQADPFLSMMVDCYDKNVKKQINGFRYSNEMQLYSAYMRMIGGKLNYETFKANSKRAVPSVRSVDRYIEKTKSHFVEGELRLKDLEKYLHDQGLPKIVSLSEDATRINGRIPHVQIKSLVLLCH